eukprot:gi/632957822/ref/XP_007894694.1/ PREDICTED: sperm-associated antigen 5 [Callorhinchus milii]
MIQRRSVKASSSENEGPQQFHTPTKMSDPRQPLRDMLLQNSVQRGLKKLDVDRLSMNVNVTGLTPMLNKLHLQSEIPSSPTLVYEDVFGEELLKSAARARGLTPLVARGVLKSRAPVRPIRPETPSLIRESLNNSSVPSVCAPSADTGNAVQPEDSMLETEVEVETVPGQDKLDKRDRLPVMFKSPSPCVAVAIPASPQPDRRMDTPQQPCPEALADVCSGSVPQMDTNRDEDQLVKTQTAAVSFPQPVVESLENLNGAVTANSAVKSPEVHVSPIPRMDMERETFSTKAVERPESSPGISEALGCTLVTSPSPSVEVQRGIGENCDMNISIETLPVLRSPSFSVETEAGEVALSPQPRVDIESSTSTPILSPRVVEILCAFQTVPEAIHNLIPGPQIEEEGRPDVEVGTSPLPGPGMEMTNLVDDVSEVVTSPVTDASEEVTNVLDDVIEEVINLVTDAIEEMTSPEADASEVTNQLDYSEEVTIPVTGISVENTDCFSEPGEELTGLLPGSSDEEVTRQLPEANAKKDVSFLPDTGVEVGTSPLTGPGMEMTNLVDDVSEEVTSPVTDASEEVTNVLDDVIEEVINLVTDAIEEMTSPVADASEEVTNQLDYSEEVTIPVTGISVENTDGFSEPGEELTGLLPGTSVEEVTRELPEANAKKDVSFLPDTGVEVGTSPMQPMPTCALMCMVHTKGFHTPTPMDAMAGWRLLGTEVIRNRVCIREVSTAITPIGTQCAESSMTPLSLADKSINTSLQEEVRQSQVVDSATLTDSLLWNISRKDLDSVPREVLERRLETALLMNDVLCSQLNDLAKSKGVGLHVGPADLREIFTQTDSTQAPEVEQQYRDLYLRTLGRMQDLEMSLEQYQQLQNFICQNREEQNRAVQEVEETSGYMASAYEEVKKERVKLRQQTQEMKQLLKSSTEVLYTMRERTRCAFQEHAQMKRNMENALTEKEAVDQCCRLLSGSSADRIARLELDLVTWKELCASLQKAGAEQGAWCEEFESTMDCVGTTHHRVVENQQKLRLQLKEAGDLAHHSLAQLQALNRRAQAALEEQAALRSQAEETEYQRDTVQQKLDHTAKELGNAQEQLLWLSSEKLQLQSELQTRSDQLTELGVERDKLMNGNAKYFVEVATTEASLKLLEVTLAEMTEKLQASEAHNKELEDTIKENTQSWEQTLSSLKQEKETGERLVLEYQEQLALFGETLRESQKKLYELSEVQAQFTILSENTEFMEQEVKLSHEQLKETEANLRSQVDLLHSRELECKELRTEQNSLRLKLETVKQNARLMCQALMQVSALKDRVQAFTQATEAALQSQQSQSGAAHDQSNLVNLSLVCEVLQAAAKRPDPEENEPNKDHERDASCSFKSHKSVFAPIEPATPLKLDNVDTWLRRVEDLGEAVSDLLDVASRRERGYHQQAQKLLQEIADMKAQRKAMLLNCDTLTDKLTDLKIQNKRLSQDLERQDKTNQNLEKTIASQDDNILYLHKQMETNFKEHGVVLALQDEVMELKRSLQRAQVETDTFREEMIKLRESGSAADIDWLQEKVELRHQVRKLRDRVLQYENTVQQMSRHRNTLEENSRKGERELAILDNLIENIRTTLLSIPHTVAGSQELKSLLHLLGED